MEDFIRLLANQKSLSGVTSLISITVYSPKWKSKPQQTKVNQFNEMRLVSNIKSKVVQKHTKAALKSAL